jgi:hypothetical protein
MFGEPGNRVKQRAVLEATLAAAFGIHEPGGKVALEYRWEAPPVRWAGRELSRGRDGRRWPRVGKASLGTTVAGGVEFGPGRYRDDENGSRVSDRETGGRT